MNLELRILAVDNFNMCIDKKALRVAMHNDG